MSGSSAGSWVSGSIVLAGALFLTLTVPAAAQSRSPAESEAWSTDSQKPSSAPPATTEQSRTPRQPAAEPPTRRNDDFDPPPAGCQYRGNKLDLIV